MGDIHKLKCLEKHFNAALNEGKKAEFRRNDRDFKVGDVMVLKEITERQKTLPDCENSFFIGYEETGRQLICLILNVTKINDVYDELNSLPEFVMISFRIVYVGDTYDQ